MPAPLPQTPKRNEYCICGHSELRHHTFSQSCMADCDCQRFIRKTDNMNAYYTGKRDPINCPANQPDPTRDYHDVPFPEGTQPKPVNDPQADAGYDQPKPASGEWTVYSVMKLRQKHWHEEDKNNAIAIAHNAAIATAKTATGMETELPTEIHVKIDPSLLPKPAGEWTVETIAVIRGRDGDFGLAAAINAALAAERKAHEAIELNISQQLAAEKSKPKTTEYAQGWDDHVLAARSQIEDLQQQLAAERTRSRTFSGKVIEFQKQLTAEKKEHEREIFKLWTEKENQLAAEREKVQIVMRYIPACSEAAVKDALAKVKEKK